MPVPPIAKPAAPVVNRIVPPSLPLEPRDLDRITTAVPWPRGLVFDDTGQLVVLARGGVGRGPVKDDKGGSLFLVDLISESAATPPIPGSEVTKNARPLANPENSETGRKVFKLWDSQKGLADIDTDRPYAGLAFDQKSQSFFVACFSGIDIPGQRPPRVFKKNGADAIHRYHKTSKKWFPVEAHRANTIPIDERERGEAGSKLPPRKPGDPRGYMPNEYYPHAGEKDSVPLHGWLNGPDGVFIRDKWLYAVAKDNHVLVRYDLSEIQRNPETAGPPRGYVLHRRSNKPNDLFDNPSAIVIQDEFLYVGLRALKSQVIRFRLDGDGSLVKDGDGVKPPDVVAVFPDDSDIIDIAFNSRGELFVSAAKKMAIWRIERPGVGQDQFTGDNNNMYVRNLPAPCSNIAFDAKNRLYICCNFTEIGSKFPGVIYLAPDPAERARGR